MAADTKIILVVEDDQSLREAICDTLEAEAYCVSLAHDGESALEVLSCSRPDLVITDVQMDPMDGFTLLHHMSRRYPDIPVLMMTAYGDIPQAVSAMQAGAVNFLAKPFEVDMLIDQVNMTLSSGPAQDSAEHRFICEDDATRQLLALVSRAAVTDTTILITGESGTGKEVLARYIHNHSPRADKPFVAVNCAAIPENMLESILFGHEKGAFTGAVQTQQGKFEQAQGGTLLLDEISEMPLALQAKLLRVLQERELERLGGKQTISLDVRVLATSNRNMKQFVRSGMFREDLYYRLNVFPVSMPPLRERRADILPVARSLLARHAERSMMTIPGIDEAAQQRLLTHSWAGNVRELENVIQRALILQQGGTITADDLHFESGDLPVTEIASAKAVDSVDLPAGLREQEQTTILQALESVHGNRKSAAERLGISQRTLRYKLARMREAGIAVPGSARIQA
ncbi:MAG: sigma-54 dependent transcriptional regulator [Gammaproteobacteria bacterium]|nr:sigma-54 dependent transcriptional regulator [Gammaproteobacteria bacterium]